MKRLSLLVLMLALPQAVTAAWLEASSANFVVYADDSEKNLRKVSEQLELYHRAVNFNAFDLPAAHVFKISDGKLHQMEAMGFRADYLSPTGW